MRKSLSRPGKSRRSLPPVPRTMFRLQIKIIHPLSGVSKAVSAEYISWQGVDTAIVSESVFVCQVYKDEVLLKPKEPLQSVFRNRFFPPSFWISSSCLDFRSLAGRTKRVLPGLYHLRRTRRCRSDGNFGTCESSGAPVSFGGNAFQHHGQVQACQSRQRSAGKRSGLLVIWPNRPGVGTLRIALKEDNKKTCERTGAERERGGEKEEGVRELQ